MKIKESARREILEMQIIRGRDDVAVLKHGDCNINLRHTPEALVAMLPMGARLTIIGQYELQQLRQKSEERYEHLRRIYDSWWMRLITRLFYPKSPTGAVLDL